MIAALNLTKSFDGKKLFDSVSFRIKSGEAFVLVGPSGEGKSVLLKTLCGLIQPEVGEVHIDGKNINDIYGKEKAAVMKKVGMLFQNNALFDSFTVEENLYFPMKELNLFTEEERQTRIVQFLESVGLLGTNHLSPSDLSGGMQKRLGIARALIVDPQIIFYDDPTAGLDPITSKKIISLIIDLKKKYNSTVVMVTNDMNRAYQLGDRIGLLSKGELIISGNVEQTKKSNDPRVKQFIYGELKGPLTENYS